MSFCWFIWDTPSIYQPGIKGQPWMTYFRHFRSFFRPTFFSPSFFDADFRSWNRPCIRWDHIFGTRVIPTGRRCFSGRFLRINLQQNPKKITASLAQRCSFSHEFWGIDIVWYSWTIWKVGNCGMYGDIPSTSLQDDWLPLSCVSATASKTRTCYCFLNLQPARAGSR